MLSGDAVDQFHDDDRFPDTRSAEETDFSSFGKGLDEIDYLDARFQHFGFGALVLEAGRSPVNRIALRSI